MSDNLKDEVNIYIAESSYYLFNQSTATNYDAWCRIISRGLLDGDIERWNNVINFIGTDVDSILGVGSLSYRLVMEFFIEEEWPKNIKVVFLSNELYGGYVFKTRKKQSKSKNKWT